MNGLGMPRPMTVVDTVMTDEGSLELCRRDERDYLITIDRRVLMTSTAHRSELILGQLGCRAAREKEAPNILFGGLGMGYTLRGALDVLPAKARVTVAELNAVVEGWCRGPIAHLSGHALDDARVQVVIADLMLQVKASPPQFYDAIVLDLYEGPTPSSHPVRDPFYGSTAISQFKAALRPGGMLAIWSEQSEPSFEARLKKAGFKVEIAHSGKGGFRYAVYLATLSPGNSPTGRSQAPSSGAKAPDPGRRSAGKPERSSRSRKR